MPTKPFRTVVNCVVVSLLAASMLAFGQEPGTTSPPSSSPSPGWHSFSNPPEPQANEPQANYPQANYPPANYPPNQVVPPRLKLQAGTFVTVRVDAMLSSDKNQAGDAFSATLTRPLVADGVVVAQRGQILGGRVAEAEKAGRVKGVSRLAVQLTDLTLVDGQQVPIETELTSLTGPTSKARDAGAIAGTTVVGAAIGGAADLGPGAAIGAGAGLIAGTVGVLLTRGRPTVIYPESVLTFRLSEPITISTDRAPQAFQYVNTNVYNRAPAGQAPPPASGWNCQGYGNTWPLPSPPPPPSNYYYPYYPYYPYYSYPWVGGFGLWYGPGFIYGRGFYGRSYGFRR
jgi:hypothetical protein